MELINVASSSSNWMECLSADHCLIKFLHCHLSCSTHTHHFLITFQVAFALNVRAAFLDVAVVWVLFHSFLGEKKVFYLQMHSVHIGYICAEMLNFRKSRGREECQSTATMVEAGWNVLRFLASVNSEGKSKRRRCLGAINFVFQGTGGGEMSKW